MNTIAGRRQFGFTLLELLIAMVLMAIMMTLLLGGLRIGASSWEQGERRAEQVSRMLVTQNFLRTYVSGALPLIESAPETVSAAVRPTPPALLFRGDEETLEYVATLPPQVRGGLYKFELYVAGDGRSKNLKLAMRPFSALTGSEGGEPIEDVVLLEGLDALRITYFGKPAREDGFGGERRPRWQDEWRQQFMPELIRMDITVSGEPPWPPLIIAPRIESPQ